MECFECLNHERAGIGSFKYGFALLTEQVYRIQCIHQCFNVNFCQIIQPARLVTGNPSEHQNISAGMPSGRRLS